jgi:hypothetical protein
VTEKPFPRRTLPLLVCGKRKNRLLFIALGSVLSTEEALFLIDDRHDIFIDRKGFKDDVIVFHLTSLKRSSSYAFWQHDAYVAFLEPSVKYENHSSNTNSVLLQPKKKKLNL